MTRLTLERDRVRAVVVPELGAGLAACDVRSPDDDWRPLMRRAAAHTRWFNDLACYLLAPWPNRIAGGRFAWRGREVRLPPDWPDGTAIHGLVKDKPWQILERTPVSAVLGLAHAGGIGFVWPWAYECRVRYEVLDDGLTIGLRVRNAGVEPMPAGVGFHPFFVRGFQSDRDEVALRYAPRGRYPARGMIPTGPALADELVSSMQRGPLRLKGRFLDDVFSGSTDAAQILWPQSGVHATFACTANLGHGVVYTGEEGGPPRDFICFEPVSMVNDGFNLHTRGLEGTGVVELAPGAELAASWTVRIGRI